MLGDCSLQDFADVFVGWGANEAVEAVSPMALSSSSRRLLTLAQGRPNLEDVHILIWERESKGKTPERVY
jgi:hypothetical protein